MKKIFVSILAILYICSSCDATVYLHYCMGKQVGFSFTPVHSANCHTCGMKKSAHGNGCCRDEKKILKSDPGQGLSAQFLSSSFAKKITYLYAEHAIYSAPVLASKVMINQLPHGPPGFLPVPGYLMNRRLLI